MHILGVFLTIALVYVLFKSSTISYDTGCAKDLTGRFYSIKDRFYKLSKRIDTIVDNSSNSEEINSILEEFSNLEETVDKLDSSELDLFQIELMDKIAQQLNRIR